MRAADDTDDADGLSASSAAKTVTDPEDFIIEFAHLVPSGGDVLDVAAGSGRHALFFARRGHRVFAVERSPELVAELRQLAASESLPLEVIEGDIENAMLLPEHFDAVVNTFFLYRPLLPQYTATLRPNGVLFFRTYSTDHMDVLGHTRPRRDYLLKPGELRGAFQGLTIVYYSEKVELTRAIATLVMRK